MRKLLQLLACALGVLAANSFAAPPTAREDGLAQWKIMESVLTSPRCLNCHTKTDYPRQGDDRHRHTFLVVRGVDGHGAPGAPCATCHHDTNSTAAGIPGAPGWHLAPLSMQWEREPGVRMTSHELCSALSDPKRNGNRDAAKLIEHHATEPLVAWAWAPGIHPDGSARAAPPVSHEAFVQATQAWAQAGSPCP